MEDKNFDKSQRQLVLYAYYILLSHLILLCKLNLLNYIIIILKLYLKKIKLIYNIKIYTPIIHEN